MKYRVLRVWEHELRRDPDRLLAYGYGAFSSQSRLCDVFYRRQNYLRFLSLALAVYAA
jgi:hypothetical protein